MYIKSRIKNLILLPVAHQALASQTCPFISVMFHLVLICETALQIKLLSYLIHRGLLSQNDLITRYLQVLEYGEGVLFYFLASQGL